MEAVEVRWKRVAVVYVALLMEFGGDIVDDDIV